MNGEFIQDGGHPSGCADLVGDHGEDVIVFLGIVLDELLGQGLGPTEDTWLTTDRDGSRADDVICPNGGSYSIAAGADIHAARVDKEIELDTAEMVGPVKPLYARSEACCVDDTGWETAWRKAEAATVGTRQGVSGIPCRSIESGEVVLKRVSELYEGSMRVNAGEWTG